MLGRWLISKETPCQCRRCEFHPWSGKIPWRRKWQPTPAFLPGKSHGQRSLQSQRVGSQRVGHDWAESWSSQARIEEEGDRTQGCFSGEHLIHSTDRLAEFRLWTKELLTSQADSWQGYFNWKASCLPYLNQHLYLAE